MIQQPFSNEDSNPFDPEWIETAVGGPGIIPYSQALLCRAREWERCEAAGETTDYDVGIFSDVLEHEISVYEPRGRIAGPLSLSVLGTRVDLAQNGEGLQLPAWVEEDGLSILGTDASAVWLCESSRVFDALRRHLHQQDDRIIYATGCGLPRMAMRRFLHRLNSQFGTPVFLIADNDTWGYFCYSIIQRGCLAPSHEMPYLQVRDVRILGLLAGDFEQVPSLQNAWEPIWCRRLAALRKYPCFQNASWQQQLDDFQKQHFAISCDRAAEENCEQLYTLLKRRMQEHSWLDSLV